jgi:ABC-type Fe3+-citrate transport system substrate-binding protein
LSYLLTIAGINWYKDGEEYLLYSEESGDMLLLSALGYFLVALMQQQPTQVFSLEQLVKFTPDHLTINVHELVKNIDELMQNLLKMHLVKVVSP